MENLKEKYNQIASKGKAKNIDTSSNNVKEWNRIPPVINSDTGELANQDKHEIEYVDDVFNNKLAENIEENLEFDINQPVTTEEFTDLLLGNDSILKELAGGLDLTHDDIRGILEVTNRVIKREDFNVYRSLPLTVQTMINNSIGIGTNAVPMAQLSAMRKSIAKMLINGFINEIQQARAKHDFANELANIYKEGTKEIEDTALDAHGERNKAYRKAADNIEDLEKKKRMLKILDQIDEARALTGLKEYAKRCKIKGIELEKPENRVFRSFLAKYKDSANNIYNIELARKALVKNINKEGSNYTFDAVNAFLIAFCKQVKAYDESNPYQHAYMYYVLYYCVMTDSDNSKDFLDNVREVIDILLENNQKIKR